MWTVGNGGRKERAARHGLAAGAILLSAIGVAFCIGWEESRWAPVEIQYATTPTSTWKRLAIVPVGQTSFCSAVDNNTMTRGRFYYFRERSLFDNGAKTPWSPHHGAIWLTGPIPAGTTQAITKDGEILQAGR